MKKMRWVRQSVCALLEKVVEEPLNKVTFEQ